MNRKLIYLISSILITIVIASTILEIIYSNNKSDSVKFKKEYEKYNSELLKIKIDRNNKIKYSNYDEIKNIIKNNTGIIYLGTPKSNWCRNIINPLFDAVNNNNIDTVYYLDISEEMDYYTVEDDELVYKISDEGNELKGTQEYFDLVELLKDYLFTYVVELDDKTYETGMYRIYLPTVIFVKDGSIVGVHISTVVDHSDEDERLTDEQYEELYNIYESYILDMKSESCPVDGDKIGC